MNKVRHFFYVAVVLFDKHLHFFGLPLVYLGIILLVLLYILGMTNHNLLFLPTLLILVGIFCYIREEKHQNKY
ncbi:hypothetical protein HMPREF0645_1907 [Hallella bergensis DSM 17361]|uniref:Uncharacterized protein n=1 Tax=Hallella bergensis DSM 17361 TaxID=585502 RepID=D1PY72_9BACT|nr:hypothetical protein HMPREF0645_1907 [Hallella bergensis DSM 17361]